MEEDIDFISWQIVYHFDLIILLRDYTWSWILGSTTSIFHWIVVFSRHIIGNYFVFHDTDSLKVTGIDNACEPLDPWDQLFSYSCS